MTSKIKKDGRKTKHGAITAQKKIKQHLMELYHLQVPVSFYIDNKVELPESFLIYDEDMDDRLIIKTRAVRILGFTDVELSYSHFSQTCHFSSKILSQKEVTRNHSLIEIDLPQSISFLEQRRYYRVNPPESDAVKVEIHLEDLGDISLSVLNLSGGGLSFLLPAHVQSVNEGMTLPIRIAFGDDKMRQINALVVSVTKFLDLKRVGIEFFDITDTERDSILAYVSKTQDEEDACLEKAKTITAEKHKILIIGEPDSSKYEFLRDRYLVTTLKTIEDQSAIAHLHPDVVISDMEMPESLKCFEILKKVQAMLFFPILVVGCDPKGMDITTESIRYSPPPFKEHFILQILRNLLYQHNLSKCFQENDWAKLKRNRGKILIVDSFKKIGPAYIKSIEKVGYEVELLEGEEDILSRIVNHKPDLILLDEKLEKTDLISLCRLMSFNKLLRDIPKVLIADTEKNPAELYARNIISDILIRPFQRHDLINKIDALI